MCVGEEEERRNKTKEDRERRGEEEGPPLPLPVYLRHLRGLVVLLTLWLRTVTPPVTHSLTHLRHLRGLVVLPEHERRLQDVPHRLVRERVPVQTVAVELLLLLDVDHEPLALRLANDSI